MRIAAVPPIRYLGTDSTGTAIVGLPQLHVRVECGGCGRYLGPSEWRHHAASVCRRCESNVGDLFVYLRGSAGEKCWLRKGDLHARWLRSRAAEMVGPPGFEPGSNRPKRSSIDQTNPRALMSLHRKGSHEGY